MSVSQVDEVSSATYEHAGPVPLGEMSVRELVRELALTEDMIRNTPATRWGRTQSLLASLSDSHRAFWLGRQRSIVVELRARREALGRDTAASRRLIRLS